MQWDDSEYAGFSDAEPWLPLETEYRKRNVQTEKQNKTSFLNLYKSILKLRNTKTSLSNGKYIKYFCKNPDIFGYFRRNKLEETFILANFSKEAQETELPNSNWNILLSTGLDRVEKIEKSTLTLRPFEAVILGY